ncbi:MAG: sugar transferase [Candidatus Sumerlaeota bacterium]|nr:sugar transferase [Candidatus Sumerlaeota bacterium]
MTAFLLIADAIALSALWLLSWYLRSCANRWAYEPINAFRVYLPPLPALLFGWICVLQIFGHYAHRERISSLNQLSRIFQAAMWCLWVSVMFSYLFFKNYELGRSVVLLSSLLIFIYLYTSRTFLRGLKTRALRHGEGARRILIVGAGPLARRVAEHLERHPEVGYRALGFIRTGHEPDGAANAAPVLGDLNEMERLIRETGSDEVFFADPALPGSQVLNCVVECETTGAQFKIVSDDFFRVLAGDAILEAVDGIPVTRLGTGRLSFMHSVLKRMMDLIVAIGLAPVWIPAAAVISLLIWLDSGRPALFKQRRVGLGGKEFDLYKFRTMRTDTNPYAVAPTAADDPRITRIGRALRKTSLDEIPQFWNVIKGDMSMVGPRPEMPFLVAQYEDWQRARLDVKPGLTGLWQVVGRKNLPLEFNIEYDLWYLRNRTLMLDLMILARTVPAVLFGKGAF